jgi:hypothetical protein
VIAFTIINATLKKTPPPENQKAPLAISTNNEQPTTDNGRS